MKKILLINAHQPSTASPGRLNQSLIDMANKMFSQKGYDIRHTVSAKSYDIEQEIENHLWADYVFIQSPVNWMSVPWRFKQYMDEVYSAGMDGRLANGDVRSRQAPNDNYGAGGCLIGKKYMLSLTFNAPQQAFGNTNEYLFQGKSVNDLFLPIHATMRFMGMTALPTFACYDVVKNMDAENIFARFQAHLMSNF